MQRGFWCKRAKLELACFRCSGPGHHGRRQKRFCRRWNLWRNLAAVRPQSRCRSLYPGWASHFIGGNGDSVSFYARSGANKVLSLDRGLSPTSHRSDGLQLLVQRPAAVAAIDENKRRPDNDSGEQRGYSCGDRKQRFDRGWKHESVYRRACWEGASDFRRRSDHRQLCPTQCGGLRRDSGMRTRFWIFPDQPPTTNITTIGIVADDGHMAARLL